MLRRTAFPASDIITCLSLAHPSKTGEIINLLKFCSGITSLCIIWYSLIKFDSERLSCLKCHIDNCSATASNYSKVSNSWHGISISIKLVYFEHFPSLVLTLRAMGRGGGKSSISPYSLVGQLPVLLSVELFIYAVYTLPKKTTNRPLSTN